MKYFIALSVVLLAASAMPAPSSDNLEVDPEWMDASVLIEVNGTRIPYGQVGFATLNGGTNGGAGGEDWTVWDAWALRDAISGDNRRVVRIRGRIDLTVFFNGSPGVSLIIGSTKSIIGADRNAMIFGGGLRVQRTRNVIVQNIRIHNALSYAPGEQPNGNGGITNQIAGPFSEIDGLGIQDGAENVWVDHCEFADDPWNSNNIPDNRRRHDGQIDIVRGANWVSISNTIFRNHNMVTLVGNSDTNTGDFNRLKTTFYLNWYQGVTQRNPRVRIGEVHVYNNLYTNIRSYGVGVGASASIYLERNHFIGSRRAWGFAAGVPNPAGHLLAIDNRMDNSRFDSNIPNNVRWRPDQYYRYGAIANGNVQNHVRSNAGPR